MDAVINRWCKLAGILQEQDEDQVKSPERDLHVFDFDDTLGVTTSPTLVAAVEYNGGDPDDPSSYIPIKNLNSRVGSKVKNLSTPAQKNVNSPGLSGNTVRSNDELDDAEAIVLDTEQYRDWKEKYIPSGEHVRLVVNPNISNDIRSAGREMFDQGKTGEIHIADFSPSSTIGTEVEPIDSMLDVFLDAEASGDMTAVVTARKGKTDLDTLGGGKVPATNASDIQDFLASEIGSNADVVYGAADFNPSDPASAKRDLIGKIHNPSIDNIHFYDDDPENARRVAQLCDNEASENAEGTELEIYNYEFSKGELPTQPTHSCTIGETKTMKRNLMLSESVLRKIIRKVLLEAEKNSDPGKIAAATVVHKSMTAPMARAATAKKFLEVDVGDCPIPDMISKVSGMREDDEEHESEKFIEVDDSDLSTESCSGGA
tara:strand:+ start:6646 stop:7935 length:1290 start_codon:yes stop_codon:yes gene_type:complete